MDDLPVADLPSDAGEALAAYRIAPGAMPAAAESSAGRPRVAAAPDSLEQPDLVSSSDRYARRFRGPAGRLMLDRQAAGIRRLIALTGASRLRVLDVGGGHMQIAPLFAEMGHSVVVHGTSEASLRRVPRRVGSNGPALATREGPLVPLPADDREFDLVVSIRMLGHYARWRELLAEQCRAARRFVIVEFACTAGFQRLAGAMFGVKQLLEGDTRRYATFAVADVASELALNGFQLVAMDRQFVLPLVLHRMLQRPGVTGRLEMALDRAGLAKRLGNPVMLLAVRTPTPHLSV